MSNFQIESLQRGYNSETPITSIATIIGITIKFKNIFIQYVF